MQVSDGRVYFPTYFSSPRTNPSSDAKRSVDLAQIEHDGKYPRGASDQCRKVQHYIFLGFSRVANMDEMLFRRS